MNDAARPCPRPAVGRLRDTLGGDPDAVNGNTVELHTHVVHGDLLLHPVTSGLWLAKRHRRRLVGPALPTVQDAAAPAPACRLSSA
ncbi:MULTISPECIES: hypothetical protein [Streptosporangium]|uniref:Uncharacterized protein n=1 Tax=Streptosporangium brasiliense TaxID=47480 RepID=A0ABT9REG1_9ACTN|nr:hypothetical protein [Streptosporangium brasiliense]MDP9867094.1 hypothetical protein [Streptosporangium brasiliense]